MGNYVIEAGNYLIATPSHLGNCMIADRMPAADAADLVRRMAGRYRLPDALRRADNLARADPPTATMTGRQPG